MILRERKDFTEFKIPLFQESFTKNDFLFFVFLTFGSGMVSNTDGSGGFMNWTNCQFFTVGERCELAT